MPVREEIEKGILSLTLKLKSELEEELRSQFLSEGVDFYAYISSVMVNGIRCAHVRAEMFYVPWDAESPVLKRKGKNKVIYQYSAFYPEPTLTTHVETFVDDFAKRKGVSKLEYKQVMGKYEFGFCYMLVDYLKMQKIDPTNLSKK